MNSFVEKASYRKSGGERSLFPAGKYKGQDGACTRFAIMRLTGCDMGESPLLQKGEEPHFYDVERFSSCRIINGDVNQLNDPLFKYIVLRIIKPDEHSHSVILLDADTKSNKAIIEDQHGVHELRLDELRDMWDKAGSMYAECPYTCMDGGAQLGHYSKEVEDEVMKWEVYATGARSGHEGYVRKERSGNIVYHPPRGESLQVRSKTSLQKKLIKRKAQRKTNRGAKVRRAIHKELGLLKSGSHSRAIPQFGSAFGRSNLAKRLLGARAAQHGLQRGFESG